MQIGGLGSGHSASDHNITNCIHDHSSVQKPLGAAAMKSSASESTSASLSTLRQDSQFSLSDWLRNVLGSGKNLLWHIWGDSPADINAAGDKQSASSQTLAQVGDPSTANAVNAASVAANASVMVQPQVQFKSVHNNPYFSAIEDTTDQKQNLWQKMKVRFHNVSGQLSGRLPKKFFGFQAKNTFQPKQEKPKEDMRKHSRYREDTLEIDCFLTDDSYLMDSYDRKGEYSTLTTKK